MNNLEVFMTVSALINSLVEMRKHYREIEMVAGSDAFSSEQQYEAQQLIEGGFYKFLGRMSSMSPGSGGKNNE